MADAEGSLGVYVHIPFCSGKCAYCDFVSFPGQKGFIDRYLKAVEAEARLTAPDFKPATLYIGGGTPSELSAEEIAELFERLHRAFSGADFSEITFEANPESLDEAKLAALRQAGVTRLSLGLQTPEDPLLAGIGRRHTLADFLRVYHSARAMGTFSISVDLIFGLPGQTLEGFLKGLDQVLALEPDHLSLYGLDLHEGTPLARRGFIPDEDLGREMFESAIPRLTWAGFFHYEISNFAKPGHESKHNFNYWRGGSYAGLGCAASSHLRGVRSRNSSDLGAYLKVVEQGLRPMAESELLQDKDKLGERIMLGLRCIDGLELDQAMEEGFKSEWKDLERRGLIERQGRWARLTRDGLFLANEAFSEFVAPFKSLEVNA